MGALPPPPGILPDFEAPDHDAYRDNYIIYMIVFYTITVLFCVVRGFVKFVRLEMLADDCESRSGPNLALTGTRSSVNTAKWQSF